MIDQFTASFFSILSLAFIFCAGLGALYIAVLYVLDITQNKHAIRRNYPVLGRFRYLFEHLGTFFRQYFFAMDREELPFNRALRTWVYRAAKDLSSSIAFGSTSDLDKRGTPLFRNAAYPVLDEEATAPFAPVVGPHCAEPFQPSSYFNISGMSYGALSKVAVEALSKGAELSGCWLNTGEGGLSPHHLAGGCDIVFQIGTANYGVRDLDGNFSESKFKEVAAHPQVKMIEVKLSQGAKPGKGGLLPGAKVGPEIASIRGIPEGQDSISPNRRKDVASDEELLEFIANLKALSGKPVGIKFVLGDPAWFENLCVLIQGQPSEHRPDFITLDSADGGTGAAPQPLMDFVGMPLNQSLPVVRRSLEQNGLSDDIRLIASGKLISPAYIAWALCEGADFVVSARGFMFALGCIQAMQCHQNTCPTGVTTHDTKLQKGLDPESKAVRVSNYHKNTIKHVEMIAHSCGQANASSLSTQNVRIVPLAAED